MVSRETTTTTSGVQPFFTRFFFLSFSLSLFKSTSIRSSDGSRTNGSPPAFTVTSGRLSRLAGSVKPNDDERANSSHFKESDGGGGGGASTA